HLRARTHRHFRRGPASVSAGLAIAERLAIEYAGKIDYARRTDGLVHPGGRRDRVVNILFRFADRTHCLVRLDLFFDGDSDSRAQVLARSQVEGAKRLKQTPNAEFRRKN